MKKTAEEIVALRKAKVLAKKKAAREERENRKSQVSIPFSGLKNNPQWHKNLKYLNKRDIPSQTVNIPNIKLSNTTSEMPNNTVLNYDKTIEHN